MNKLQCIELIKMLNAKYNMNLSLSFSNYLIKIFNNLKKQTFNSKEDFYKNFLIQLEFARRREIKHNKFFAKNIDLFAPILEHISSTIYKTHGGK
ncbi:MAG: hypothetical protein LBH55_01665 [Mycoplasmataceae bacterium]|jgi:DNA-binding transcriptional regulator GbsR (MarR family)|nr:hypothetical protein [Mycoplasmataceae bacterium]